MIDKRLWFKKTGMLKYISHLDFSHYMGRTLKMTGLPLWYTEGFNPHLHMVFTQPLSLGMTGVCESLDIRVTEPVSNDEILKRVNQKLVSGLSFFAVTDPVMKPGEVAFASYDMVYTPMELSEKSLAKYMESFSQKKELIIEKRSKSGSKPFDLAPYIHLIKWESDGDMLRNTVTLPAGSNENVNPRLLGDAFSEFCGVGILQEIVRTGLFNGKMEFFK